MPPYNKRRRLNYYKRRNDGVSINYHGNYVGPGWSAGKFQPSVYWSKVPAVDDWDMSAKRHDRAHRLQNSRSGGNKRLLNEADDAYYNYNKNYPGKRGASALAVKAQRMLRGNPKQNTDLSVVRGGTTHMPPTPKSDKVAPTSFPQKNVMPKRNARTGGMVLVPARGNKAAYYRKARPNRRGRKRPIKSTRRGRITKRKRARKTTKISRFSTHGVIYKYENGSSINDPQALYIGVSDMPFDEVYIGACRCMVRDLFRQMGILVEDWLNLIPVVNGELQFRYSYISGQTEALTTPAATAILGTWSFAEFGSQIATVWKAAFGTSADHRIKEIWLEKTTNVFAAGTQRTATIPMSNYVISVDNYASMKIQNTTTGDNSTDAEDTDITRNPLVARVYHLKGNALIPRAYASPISGQKIVADTKTGLFGFTATQQGERIYKKLPPASQFVKCYKSNQFKMQPGSIKAFTVRYKKTMRFNNLFVLNGRGMADDTQNYQLPFGTSVLVGFEKLLDSRNSFGSNVKINYQWDLTVKVASRYNDRSYTTPLLNVITVEPPE